MLPSSMPSSSAEIPVWVNGVQRWISGICRKTTCDDVIRVLLRAEGVHAHEDRHTSRHYGIVERWRKVERPLDGRARILKVWSTWGDEQSAVRFTLRRVSPTTPRDVKTHHKGRSKHHSTVPHNRARLLQTVHPRRFLQQAEMKGDGNATNFTDTMEKLMKLILAQGETIQSQLRRLHDRDEQINRIEHKVHKARVEKLGSNYLLETYLGSIDQAEQPEEKGDDSGVAEVGSGNGSAELRTSPVENEQRWQRAPHRSAQEDDDGAYCAAGESSSSDENEATRALADIRACIALWERIVCVNKRLEKQEQCLVKLHVKLRRYSSVEKQSAEIAENATQNAADVLREQIEDAVALSAMQDKELEASERTLQETKNELDARHRLLDTLQDELRAADAETAQLQNWLARPLPPALEVTNSVSASATTAPASSRCATNKLVDSDSNSDTGLSSLHSSGEEGVYVLDTLV